MASSPRSTSGADQLGVPTASSSSHMDSRDSPSSRERSQPNTPPPRRARPRERERGMVCMLLRRLVREAREPREGGMAERRREAEEAWEREEYSSSTRRLSSKSAILATTGQR